MIVALLTMTLGVVALGLLVASALSKDPAMRAQYFRVAMVLTVVAVVLDALSRMFSNTNRPAARTRYVGIMDGPDLPSNPYDGIGVHGCSGSRRE